jgi:transcriptional regulator with XRE-family HTH domain
MQQPEPLDALADAPEPWDQLAAWLAEPGRTQAGLAALLGVSQATVSDWKNRKRSPDIVHRIALFAFCGVVWLARDERTRVSRLIKGAPPRLTERVHGGRRSRRARHAGMPTGLFSER